MLKRQELKVSTRVMYDELSNHNAQVEIIDAASSLIEYTDLNNKRHILFSTLSDKSSAVGSSIANNKGRTGLLAQRLGIRVPRDKICRSIDEALSFLESCPQVVLKPLNNSGGIGVTTHLTSISAVKDGYAYAHKYSSSVLVQEHVVGSDLRLLIVAGKFCSAVERRAAHVTGDGHSTVRELIEAENRSSMRSDNYMTTLSTISLDSAKRHLGKAIKSIPPKAKEIQVVGPANLSIGGTAHEATHLVPKVMIQDAELIAQRLCLGICGVDMIWNQDTDQYYLIEVNANPGIDLHNDPFWKTSSDAAERYVKWLIDPTQQMTRD